MIQPHYDASIDLTTYVCSGALEKKDIEEQLRALYKGTPSLHAMWDFTAADVSPLSSDDILEIADLVKSTAHSRAGGKTALVFSTAMLTQMGTLLQSIAEIEVPDAKIKIFNDLKSSLAWIGS